MSSGLVGRVEQLLDRYAPNGIFRLWEQQPQFTLCRDTGLEARNGQCVAHGGDACLFQYVQVTALNRAFAAAAVNLVEPLARARDWQAKNEALEICVNWILAVRRAARNPETSWLSASALIEGATKTLDAQREARALAAVSFAEEVSDAT